MAEDREPTEEETEKCIELRLAAAAAARAVLGKIPWTVDSRILCYEGLLSGVAVITLRIGPTDGGFLRQLQEPLSSTFSTYDRKKRVHQEMDRLAHGVLNKIEDAKRVIRVLKEMGWDPDA